MASIHVTLPDDLAQKQKAKSELEAKLIEATESGPAIEPTPDFWAELRARVHHRAENPQS
jgi:hypothetical protein